MTYQNRFFFLFLFISFSSLFLYSKDVEEVISVGSYIGSKELNASPVDVITDEDFKNLRVSSVVELSKYLT